MRPLPVTDMLAARSLALPIGGHITQDLVVEVCEAIASAKQFA